MVNNPMAQYPYRVFLSYAHEDGDLAAMAAQALTGMGLNPVWDRDIRPGAPFTDAIKGFIAHSHIFMPLITGHSALRPWVHQETGYAMALNIPILPVALAAVPGEMAAQLQAMVVKDDLSDFTQRLAAVDLGQVVHAPHTNPSTMLEVTTWSEKRTELLASYGRQVLQLGASGRVQQRAALSSFSIPNKSLTHALWALREGANRRSNYQRQLQRAEREVLEQHARAAGCDLIIDPTFSLARHGEESTKARLWILKQFLEDMPDDKVRVVCSRRAREGNLTVVGDWFSAESMSPDPVEGHRQTVFDWHAPTVLQVLQRFQADFVEECLECNSDASRGKAIADIEGILGGWKPGGT